ncbi:MAG TPA: NAD(P)/FAD-dependent oxidoreductase [Candidatus Limnocylindrales bacterium]|nr:NAD(P)/FAD-dependent oxidoreductase [Candidatus Limnocylindrales bacterium]
MTDLARIVVIGAGVGGLTAAALLAQAGCGVTVLEGQVYPGGSAGTFFHKGYRFDAGATVAGGFQPGGPHAILGAKLGIDWNVRLHDPAWVVHLPDREVALTRDNADVLAKFPGSAAFWDEQTALARIGWTLAGEGLPWPPSDAAELMRLAGIGMGHFPRDLRLAPFALMSTWRWLGLRGLHEDRALMRFIDAQLLISAQTTARGANAAYSATALDLARQGVYHASGGMGTIAEQLVEAVEAAGGQVLYRQKVEAIEVREGLVTAVRTKKGETFDADFVLANLTPWSLDDLLGEASPRALKRETASRKPGWGAFVLHLGLRANALPADLPDHHQFIKSYDGPLGETRSIFLSMSPGWDSSRAPAGYRAATMTTHTEVGPWWEAMVRGEDAYAERKAAYAERLLEGVERSIPGFRTAAELVMPGTPLTYQFYTGRHRGMVGGFPQTSLFQARGPRTGIPNLRLVGDSIFPGQSTAGVSLGALRVAADVRRQLPRPTRRMFVPPEPEPETERVLP